MRVRFKNTREIQERAREGWLVKGYPPRALKTPFIDLFFCVFLIRMIMIMFDRNPSIVITGLLCSFRLITNFNLLNFMGGIFNPEYLYYKCDWRE